jgi:hypothetical protein
MQARQQFVRHSPHKDTAGEKSHGRAMSSKQ